MVKLYTYWRSTTSYRVRIALNLKRVGYDSIGVDLVSGAQKHPNYTAINPIAGVPTLVLEDGTALTQSMAILDWLDKAYPEPALVAADPIVAAQERASALVIACDIHPVNNLKVGARLRDMGHSQEDVVAWMNNWMARGFEAFQALLPDDKVFCFSNTTPGLADICLIPQLYNAHRWGCDLSPFSRLTDIEQHCLALPAFNEARPETQPDAA